MTASSVDSAVHGGAGGARTGDDASTAEVYDVVVIGGGPAGLSAALNLVRSRRQVLVIDANRPRNAATLASHGFLTRDGIGPLELRKLGRDEIDAYPEGTTTQGAVDSVRFANNVWTTHAVWRGTEQTVTSRTVIVATGLREQLPNLPSMRGFYGTSLHSCIECDVYEKADTPLVLIGETDDLVDRALLLASATDTLTVCTNGATIIGTEGRARLAAAGIALDQRSIADLEGGRDGMTGVRFADGDILAATGGFVRPHWDANLEWLDVAAERDAAGLLVVDRVGRTTFPSLYAVGDITPPGPEQLIIAAGHGAETATAVHRDLISGIRDPRDAVE